MYKTIKALAAAVCMVFTASGCIGGGTGENPVAFISESSKQDALSVSDENKTQVQIEVQSFSSTKGFSSDVHVLSSEKGNILVDPGFYSEDLLEYVGSIGGLDAILITHGHWDNIHALDEAVKANPDAKVYIHELDFDFLRDPVLNASAPNGFSLMVNTEPLTFTEGFYHIGGYDFEVIHTPGHTCGCCTFYFKKENIMFSGDTFMIPFVGSADHPTGSKEDRTASIEKFKQRYFPDDMKIYPGHRGNTTYAEIMKTNVDLQ